MQERKCEIENMEESKGRVCVTGGTGFIGSWIIKNLLQHGYSVNTTVRSNPEHKRDISFLTNLPGASQNLQILSADLSNPESFGAAIEGCIGVFHVASPMEFELKEPEEVMIKRTTDGALGILKACLNSNTVKRVIYTSSSSAVLYHNSGKHDHEEVVLNESFWSDVDYLRASKINGWFYYVSKTLTEKAVLEFGEESGLDVVTLVPTFVIGPFICPKLPGSVRASLSLAFGDKGPFGSLASLLQVPMVHVDDVARAHIFLLEHANPKGSKLKQTEGAKLQNLSSKKLIDAGFVFKYGLEEMVDDAIRCCKEKGYI
ncbi:Vestitone reductase [Arachis hypogaea]|nr:Vestitone reductase [Arachis hypogaea]